MRIAMLLITCLSLIACQDDPSLPPRPDGESCTHFFGIFVCDSINDINAPQKEYNNNSPEMEKAWCVPFETKKRYDKYVEDLKEAARKRCQ